MRAEMYTEVLQPVPFPKSHARLDSFHEVLAERGTRRAGGQVNSASVLPLPVLSSPLEPLTIY
jgi:hypothetical protein